jgi:hypothetical protein
MPVETSFSDTNFKYPPFPSNPKLTVMKQISLWAKHHKWPARLMIVFGYFVLNSIGWYWGNILSGNGWEMPSVIFWISVFIFSLIAILYPGFKNKAALNSYNRQKTADIVLITTGFIFIFFAGNRADNWFIPENSQTSQVVARSSSIADPSSLQPEKEKKKLFKSLRKKIRALIREQRKAHQDLSKGERTVLTILAILLFIAALMGLAALSCNLSCSGADGAAVLVGILGGALLIFGFSRALRGIRRKRENEEPRIAEPPPG